MIRLNVNIDKKSYTTRSLLFLLFLCCWVGLSSNHVRAETIVLSDTVPLKNTNWVDTLEIPAFEPKWGALTAVTVTFETPIAGSVSYENTSNEPVAITSTHAISINLQLPNGHRLHRFPNVHRVDTVPPFDGLADFAGLSGATFAMSTSITLSQHYTTSTDLAWFYGPSPLRFLITATGASSILGPGNFDAILRSQAAGANFTTYFTYLPLDFAVKKLTNQRHADDANGTDVPPIFAGAPVTWTYLVTNTGAVAIPMAEIAMLESDPSVTPIFDPTSDDGDRLLSPGEVWRYTAVGKALDLRLAYSDHELVDGCRGVLDSPLLRAYENSVTVEIRGLRKMDLSHYCNPTTRRSAPALTFAKLINNADANGPDDPDVPFVFPGALLEWRYLVTNTGNISFTVEEVTVADDDPTLTIHFDATSDDGDGLLAPGEQWRFVATAAARNLLFDMSDITLVDGCDPALSGNKSVAYRNIGTVTVGELSVSDPAHYCNIPPTVLTEDSGHGSDPRPFYLPLIVR